MRSGPYTLGRTGSGPDGSGRMRSGLYGSESSAAATATGSSASDSSTSSDSSRSSISAAWPDVLIASSYMVTSFGQATVKRSIPPSATASSIRFSLGRWASSRFSSFIQMRPPPAPQQNELSRLRGISTSSQPMRRSTSRGGS